MSATSQCSIFGDVQFPYILGLKIIEMLLLMCVWRLCLRIFCTVNHVSVVSIVSMNLRFCRQIWWGWHHSSADGTLFFYDNLFAIMEFRVCTWTKIHTQVQKWLVLCWNWTWVSSGRKQKFLLWASQPQLWYWFVSVFSPPPFTSARINYSHKWYIRTCKHKTKRRSII